MKNKEKAAAAALAAMLLLAACSKVDETITSETIPSIDDIPTQAVETTEETTVPEEISETESETKKTAPFTLFPHGGEDTTSSDESTSSDERSWSETAKNAVMYVRFGCYSVETPHATATPVSYYSKGSRVTITAITDTGYYRISGGGFIKADYLSDEYVAPDVTAEVTRITEAPSDETHETTRETKVTQAPRNTETEEEDTDIPEFITEYPDDENLEIDDWEDQTYTVTTSTESETTEYINTTVETEATVSETRASSIIQRSDYRVEYTSRYVYKALSADEQKLYADIVNAAYSLQSIVKAPDSLSYNQILKIYKLVYSDEPEIFWLGNTVTISGQTLNIRYNTANASEISEKQARVDNAVNSVMSKVNSKSSTFDKLEVIYDYVVLNNDFEETDNGTNSSVYNAFTHSGGLQCLGYAKTVQYLCDMAGIDCVTVVGTNDEGHTHAWNIVYCGDGYYNFDTTWGDPINDYDSTYIRHTYFLVPDSWIHNITHYNVNKFKTNSGEWVNCFNPPSCSGTAYNYFNHKGLTYSDKDSAEAALKAQIDKAIADHTNVIEIRVTDTKLFDLLTSKDMTVELQKYAREKNSTVSLMRHTSDVYKSIGVVYFDIKY